MLRAADPKDWLQSSAIHGVARRRCRNPPLWPSMCPRKRSSGKMIRDRYGSLSTRGRISRITCTPAMDYRLIRRQQKPSMNSSNTPPSKPRNNSPRTVKLKLRSISRDQDYVTSASNSDSSGRGTVPRPPEKSADKMESGDPRQGDENFFDRA